MKNKFIETAFLLPVVNGALWLGQRGTPPYKGWWGAIGGKSDLKKSNPWDNPRIVRKIGGNAACSIADTVCRDAGREYLQGTAVREFCEEIFSARRFPENFQIGDLTDVTFVGAVLDNINVAGTRHFTSNHLYLARVNRQDFSPNYREITGFKALGNLAEERIFPITKLAMAHIHFALEFNLGQIPPVYKAVRRQIEPLLQSDFIQPGEQRPTAMFGPVMYYSEAYIGRPTEVQRVQRVLERIRGE